MGPSGLLFPDLPLAQLVQADVGHDPVQPGMKAAIEPERLEVPVDAEKRFLVDIPRIFRRPQQVHGEPKHTLIVSADQLLERVLVAALGRPNQRIHVGTQSGAYRSGCILSHKLR
jgi:hypothetical protein